MSRILVIEDHPINAQLVHAILAARGHEIIEAATLAIARERLGESLPDLVLTDYRLPDGGGDAILAHIRSDPAMAHVPVVIVTAVAMAGDRDRLLALGFDGYASKPLDVTAFERTVDEALERGAKRKPPAVE
jgi:two-component system cell cycle response regulator